MTVAPGTHASSDDFVYLNHAGTSWPKPEPVRAAVAAALDAHPDAAARTLDAAHDAVERALALPRGGASWFTQSCTQALAAALGALPWEAGDVLVTSALEHRALTAPIEGLVRDRGVVWQQARYAVGTPFALDDLTRWLDRGRVRLVAVCAASNVSGERLPVAEIASAAHARGVPVLLDAAQSAAVVPIDHDALGLDAVAFAGHKGPQAPHGVGGLWVGPRFSGLRDALHACELGSVNVAAVAGLVAGLRWLAEGGPDPFAAARSARADLAARLRPRDDCQVYGGDGPCTATLSLRVPALPLAEAEPWLRRFGVFARAGRHCAPAALAALGAPEGTLRISFGPRPEPAAAARVLGALDALRP